MSIYIITITIKPLHLNKQHCTQRIIPVTNSNISSAISALPELVDTLKVLIFIVFAEEKGMMSIPTNK